MRLITDQCMNVKFPPEMMAKVRFTRMFSCIVDESRTLGFFIMGYEIPGAFQQNHHVSVILTARADVQSDTWDVAESIAFFKEPGEAIKFVNEKIILNRSIREAQFMSAYDVTVNSHGTPERKPIPVWQLLFNGLKQRL